MASASPPGAGAGGAPNSQITVHYKILKRDGSVTKKSKEMFPADTIEPLLKEVFEAMEDKWNDVNGVTNEIVWKVPMFLSRLNLRKETSLYKCLIFINQISQRGFVDPDQDETKGLTKDMRLRDFIESYDVRLSNNAFTLYVIANRSGENACERINREHPGNVAMRAKTCADRMVRDYCTFIAGTGVCVPKYRPVVQFLLRRRPDPTVLRYIYNTSASYTFGTFYRLGESFSKVFDSKSEEGKQLRTNALGHLIMAVVLRIVGSFIRGEDPFTLGFQDSIVLVGAILVSSFVYTQLPDDISRLRKRDYLFTVGTALLAFFGGPRQVWEFLMGSVVPSLLSATRTPLENKIVQELMTSTLRRLGDARSGLASAFSAVLVAIRGVSSGTMRTEDAMRQVQAAEEISRRDLVLIDKGASALKISYPSPAQMEFIKAIQDPPDDDDDELEAEEERQAARREAEERQYVAEIETFNTGIIQRASNATKELETLLGPEDNFTYHRMSVEFREGMENEKWDGFDSSVEDLAQIPEDKVGDAERIRASIDDDVENADMLMSEEANTAYVDLSTVVERARQEKPERDFVHLFKDYVKTSRRINGSMDALKDVGDTDYSVIQKINQIQSLGREYNQLSRKVHESDPPRALSTAVEDYGTGITDYFTFTVLSNRTLPRDLKLQFIGPIQSYSSRILENSRQVAAVAEWTPSIDTIPSPDLLVEELGQQRSLVENKNQSTTALRENSAQDKRLRVRHDLTLKASGVFNEHLRKAEMNLEAQEGFIEDYKFIYKTFKDLESIATSCNKKGHTIFKSDWLAPLFKYWLQKGFIREFFQLIMDNLSTEEYKTNLGDRLTGKYGVLSVKDFETFVKEAFINLKATLLTKILSFSTNYNVKGFVSSLMEQVESLHHTITESCQL